MPLTVTRMEHARDLFLELLGREMKLRYERSVLGMLWAALNPLLQITIFTFVFRGVLRVDIPNYPLFVFTGVLAWNWLRDALLASTGAITDHRELVRQPGFPIGVLPVVAVAVPLVDLLAALPALAVFLVIADVRVTAALLLLPAVVMLQFLFTQGLGFLLASVHVTFRDTRHLLGVGLTMLFYLTPIFYTPDMVPPTAQGLLALNPVQHLIGAYRRVLLDGALPDPWVLLALAALDAVLLPIGWAAFVRARFTFVEEL